MDEDRPWTRGNKRPGNRGPGNDPSRLGQQNQSFSRDRMAPNQHQNRQPNRGAHGSQGPPRAGGGDHRENAAVRIDEHIPVNGFNAQEAKEVLRQGYNVPSDEKPLVYKAPAKDSNTPKSGPWASKPSTMGNGKDFYLELRKQMFVLLQQQQQQNNTSGAG